VAYSHVSVKTLLPCDLSGIMYRDGIKRTHEGNRDRRVKLPYLQVHVTLPWGPSYSAEEPLLPYLYRKSYLVTWWKVIPLS